MMITVTCVNCQEPFNRSHNVSNRNVCDRRFCYEARLQEKRTNKINTRMARKNKKEERLAERCMRDLGRII